MFPTAAKFGLPYLTGLSSVRAYADFFRDPIGCMTRLYEQHGPAVAIGNPVGSDRHERLFLVGKEYNKQVLMDDDKFRPMGQWPIRGPKGSAQNNLRRNMRQLHGAEHAHISKYLKQHIGRGKVKDYTGKTVRVVLDDIKTWPVGRTTNIQTLIRRLTQQLAFNLIVGENDKARASQLGEMINQFHLYNWNWKTQIFQTNFPGLAYRRLLRHAEGLQTEILQWAQERRDCPAHTDLRATMVNGKNMAGCPLSDNEIVGNLAGTIWAAYDTSATTLTWILVLLAQHPHIMADLVDELSALHPLESLDSDQIADQLALLPLLDAVVKESLRILPPAPVIILNAIKDTEVAGYPVKRKSSVILSPFLTHRLPPLYEKPDEFRPERWFGIKPTAYEYLPFSAGHRRCPGYWLGLSNVKIVLAAILPRFRFTLASGARIDRRYAATIVPKQGVPMMIARQDRNFSASSIVGNIHDVVRFVPEHRIILPAIQYDASAQLEFDKVA